MRILCVLLIALVLGGCGAQPVLETVEDSWLEDVAAEKELVVQFPIEAAAPVLQNADAGQLYLCNGYTLTLQTLPGGDLDETMRQVTGFSKEQAQTPAAADLRL